MATSLAAQLLALGGAGRGGGGGGTLAGGSRQFQQRSTLLFTAKQAADVDTHAIYAIGCEGLEALCRIEPQFVSFRNSLFGQASLGFVRDQQTQEVLDKLDETIRAFCEALSDHFLTPGCFKALEYLIRRYRVNEFNTLPLLMSALPYHGTNEFVRLVQTLSLPPAVKGSAMTIGCWSWLHKIQSSGASLTRDVLMQRCVNDQVVLRSICQGARRVGQKKSSGGRTFLSFYAVLLCKVVASAERADEELIELLLPFLTEGLETSSSSDYSSATLMILAELCGRVTLSKDFLSAIIISAVKSMDTPPSRDQIRTVLLVLAHISTTQPHIKDLPTAALKVLIAVPSLIPELSSLLPSRARISPLLSLLTRALLSRFLSSSAHVTPGSSRALPETAATAALDPLLSLCSAGLVRGASAESLAKTLLLAAPTLSSPIAVPVAAASGKPGHSKSKKDEVAAPAAADATGSMIREGVIRLLKILERRMPVEVDAAINSALSRSNVGKDESGAAAAAASSKAIFDLALGAFHGTVHAPLHGGGSETAEQGGNAGGSLTLEAASRAPQSAVRRSAMEHADRMLTLLAAHQDEGQAAVEDLGRGEEDSKARLAGCALAGLADHDWDVVQAALGMSQLSAAVPPAVLLPAINAVLQRVGATLFQVERPPSKVVTAVASVSALALGALGALAASPATVATTAAAAVDCATLFVLGLASAPSHALPVLSALLRWGGSEASDGGIFGILSSSSAAPGTLASSLGNLPEPPADVASSLPPTASPAAKKALKKEQRVGRALAVRRSMVSAVGTYVSSSPSYSLNPIEEVVRLAGLASHSEVEDQEQRSLIHVAAAHVLVLGLATALAQSPHTGKVAAGSKVGKRGGSGGAGKGRDHTISAPAAAGSFTVASALQRVCMAEVRALLPMSSSPNWFRGWEKAATLLFPASSSAATGGEAATVALVPGPDHVFTSQSDLPRVHAVALCAALRSALSHHRASAEGRGDVREFVGVKEFVEIASLSPRSAFRGHLASLVVAASKGHGDSSGSMASFLRQVYASPSSPLLPAGAKTAALELYASALEGATVRSSPSDLPYALAAAGDTDSAVRIAAVSLLSALGKMYHQHPPSGASVEAAALAEVCTALAAPCSVALIAADPLAAASLLHRLLNPTSSSSSSSLPAATPIGKGKGHKAPPSPQAHMPPPSTLSKGARHHISDSFVAFLASLSPPPSANPSSPTAADLSAVQTCLLVLLGGGEEDIVVPASSQLNLVDLRAACLAVVQSLLVETSTTGESGRSSDGGALEAVATALVSAVLLPPPLHQEEPPVVTIMPKVQPPLVRRLLLQPRLS